MKTIPSWRLSLRAKLVLLVATPLMISFALIGWLEWRAVHDVLGLLPETGLIELGDSGVGRVAIMLGMAVRNQVFIASVGLLLLTLITALLVTLRPVRRMKTLSEAARRISEGDFSAPVRKGRNDEIGDVEAALEAMRLSLRANLDLEARRAAEARRAEEMALLFESSQALVGTLDLPTLLGRAAEQLARALDASSAYVFSCDLEAATATLQAEHFTPAAAETERVSALGETYDLNLYPRVLEALRAARPWATRVSDRQADPESRAMLEMYGAKSALRVPMLTAGQMRGYAVVWESRTDRVWSEAEVRLGQTIANLAAGAIERARLLESEARRRQEAETLSEASTIVAATLNQTEAINRILEQLARVVPYDSASVQLLGEGYLEIVGGGGWLEPDRVMGLRFPVPGNNPNTVVVQERRPYILDDAPLAYPTFRHKPSDHIRSWLGVPLIVRDRVIGMLSMDRARPNSFTADHARLAGAFADQVALAIENARLYAEAEQRANEMLALRAVMADISAELELPRLLEVALQRAVVLLGAAGGDLATFDPARRELAAVVTFNSGSGLAGLSRKLGEGVLGRVAETSEPLLIPDYSAWEPRSPDHAGTNWNSVMAAPLLIGGQLVGVIGLVHTDPQRRFQSSDLRLLMLFAQQAAIAIENARLYQDALLAAETRGILHRASYEIGASLKPEEVFAAIHQAVAQLMPAEAFVIALVAESGYELEAVYRVDRGQAVPLERMPLDRGLSGRVVATGESVLIHDLAASRHIEIVRFGDPAAHVRSVLAVPMRHGNSTSGMLSAQSYQPGAYSPDDLQALSTLANQAAVAIENARLFQQVQQLAITDGLTGLYNHRHLLELARLEFDRARRYSRPLAAIMLDIDHFKRVNDAYGHAVGNQVLSAVASRCQQKVREIDILARYGGEEFVVLLPENDLAGAHAAAERIRRTVSAAPVLTDQGALHITVSLGVAMAAPQMADPDQLLNAADAAMYAAKQAGRDRVEVFVPGQPRPPSPAVQPDGSLGGQ